eukprot:3202927-Alexandrium_andersonii.AAC.1
MPLAGAHFLTKFVGESEFFEGEHIAGEPYVVVALAEAMAIALTIAAWLASGSFAAMVAASLAATATMVMDQA